MQINLLCKIYRPWLYIFIMNLILIFLREAVQQLFSFSECMIIFRKRLHEFVMLKCTKSSVYKQKKNQIYKSSFNILLIKRMIDRALGFNTPQSYYFQLYPVNLVLLKEPVPSTESQFKFSIYKGQQKFDQNKIMTQSNFIMTDGTQVMPFRGCQLNFYLPNFNKARKILFTLKLNEKQGNQEYDIGAIDIDPANYINEFKEKGQNRFQEKVQISEQYAIQFQMYLEKSRFALEKIVKSFKNERDLKSPLRQRKTPVQQRRSPVEQNRFTQNNREEQPEVIQQAPQVEKSAGKISSKLAEQTSASKQQQVRQEPAQKPAQKSRPGKSILNLQQKPVDSKQKSEKSVNIISPAVRTKQMKRTSGRNEATIKSSVRLNKQIEQKVVEIATKSDPQNWTNHLPLVIFTIVGIFMIYWVMHPTRRV